MDLNIFLPQLQQSGIFYLKNMHNLFDTAVMRYPIGLPYKSAINKNGQSVTFQQNS